MAPAQATQPAAMVRPDGPFERRTENTIDAGDGVQDYAIFWVRTAMRAGLLRRP